MTVPEPVSEAVAEARVPLAGGDVNIGENVVVRVGDTVRRPVGPHTPAVSALLDHFERAGFDGAPRNRGRDEQGHHVLTFVVGEPGLPPIPAGDDVLAELGALLRRMHDAQEGFIRPPDAAWHRVPLAPADGEVICHNDLFPPNVILREGLPAALVDWDLAAPMPRIYDVASAANHWCPLAHAKRAERFGLSNHRAGERLRILCDGYGLDRATREELLDVVAHRNRMGHEIHRLYGGVERRAGWRQMWDAGSGDEILARAAWFEAHRVQLLRYLA